MLRQELETAAICVSNNVEEIAVLTWQTLTDEGARRFYKKQWLKGVKRHDIAVNWLITAIETLTTYIQVVQGQTEYFPEVEAPVTNEIPDWWVEVKTEVEQLAIAAPQEFRPLLLLAPAKEVKQQSQSKKASKKNKGLILATA